MNGEEERNPLDVVRLVLGVLILVSLLTPNSRGSNSSNLREEDEMRRQKLEARSLTNKLAHDVRQMRDNPSRYAYNVSGLFSGHWNRSSNSVAFRKSWISLAYRQDTPRLPNNSSLQGTEGSFSFQLYDQGVYREGIHQVNGMLTMIEGEQDSGDDALSLSVLGLYFIDTGHLSLMTNPFGGRLAIAWEAPSSASAFNVTNAYPEVIGYSSNSTNLLYLNRRDLSVTPSPRCLYRLDADVLPLPPSVDPEITRNRNHRVWLNATGVLRSQNCGVNVTMQFSGQTMDTRRVQRKSRVYTIVLIMLTMLEGALGTETLRRLLSGSALSASLLSFVLLAAIDLLLAMLHSLTSVFFFGLFSDFYLIAFGRLFLFSIVEMRVIFVVWRTRCPDLNAQNVAMYQRRLSAIFFALYLLIIVALIAVYNQTALGNVFIALFYSFWLPQIIRSLQLGQRPPLPGKQMLLISLAKLFLPLYLLLCPVNLLRSFTEVAVPRAFAWKIVLWVAVQTALVMVQRLNPYLILPKALRPKKFDYHVLPTESLDPDCAICMSAIDFGDEGSFMVTPCNHAFHSECLHKWMDVKLECPTCRAQLPDVRYL